MILPYHLSDNISTLSALIIFQGISELIISPGSIVILPYHLSDKISTLSALIIFQGLSELIISPGSIVILPYYLSDNISILEKPTILQLAETVASPHQFSQSFDYISGAIRIDHQPLKHCDITLPLECQHQYCEEAHCPSPCRNCSISTLSALIIFQRYQS